MIGSIEAANRIVPGLSVQNDVRTAQEVAARPNDALRGVAVDEAAQVTLSAAGLAASRADSAAGTKKVAPSGEGQALADSTDSTRLTPEELKQVDELRARDREVRAHEQAHQAAAGGLAGGASYTYQRGPDGVSYAVGGEVQISLQKGRTPEETIANAQTIRAAALAPADPSPQDRSVAAAAGQMEAEARAEQAQQESLASKEGGLSVGQTAGSTASTGADQPTVRDDAAVDRTRAGLTEIYGQVAASSTGFAAVA